MKKADLDLESLDTPARLLDLTSTILLEREICQMPIEELHLYYSHNTLKIVNIFDVLSQQHESN